MMSRSKLLVLALAGLAASSLIACGSGSGSVYVGVAAPGPWYGYPYPGRYPGGGVWVGVPVCCEDMDAMAEPVESTERYAEVEAGRKDGQVQPAAAGEEASDSSSSEQQRSKKDESRQDG